MRIVFVFVKIWWLGNNQKCAGVKCMGATGSSWSSQKFVNLGSYLSLSPPPLKKANKFSLSNFWHRSKYFSRANFFGERKYDEVCMNWLPPRTSRQVDKSLISCLSLAKKSWARPCKSQFKKDKRIKTGTDDIVTLCQKCLWNCVCARGRGGGGIRCLSYCF